MNEGSHKETQMVKVSQDSPSNLPGKFFSGEQQSPIPFVITVYFQRTFVLFMFCCRVKINMKTESMLLFNLTF